ncbi:ABC transporter permease OS=Streptomyces glaucescens OX=1907 GN=SGLAU_03360 PE=3 SV=1 [Streptomyces glaucescens]
MADFTRIALPMIVPGLVTVFLFQFVAIWNNFLLPYIMLSDDEKFPITLGLHTLLEQGANTPALYTLVITGAFLAVIPLVALFLVIQRCWSLDLLSGAVKS